MAAVDTEDVTANLPTLQFEAALAPQEKELLYLRARSHALTSSACAQGAFLVAVLNDARRKIIEKKVPAGKKSSKLLQEAPKRDPMLIGIIGCGRLGKQLANTLLKFADVQPEELFISTRRPETLAALQSKGVHCGFDNVRVCSTVDLLFIACLPSQFQTVAKEIKGHLACPVYVLVGALPLARVFQVLDYEQILKPEMSWETNIDTKDTWQWSHNKDLIEMLGDSTYCEMTCPLQIDLDDPIVTTDCRWGEIAIFIFINMCTTKELVKSEVVRLCNSIVLGFGPTDNFSEALKVEDVMADVTKFTIHDVNQDEECFPLFDLGLLNKSQSHVGKRLTQLDGIMRRMFIKRYKVVFDKFQYWKGVSTNAS